MIEFSLIPSVTHTAGQAEAIRDMPCRLREKSLRCGLMPVIEKGKQGNGTIWRDDNESLGIIFVGIFFEIVGSQYVIERLPHFADEIQFLGPLMLMAQRVGPKQGEREQRCPLELW